MTVDIRASVICDLGEVISGGWSDDHVQGTGLIRTRGELVLKGIHRPTLGQHVQLAYVQNGYASRFPRSLRVLSAFADPFRRQTTIQLGCKLTLLENLKPKQVEDQTAKTWDDPENDYVLCNTFAEGTVSISAAYVASECIAKLNLTSDPIPLTNWYTVEEFDLTPGYVAVLSDLLVSESYVGYLDAAETLKIVTLSDFTGTLTAIDQDRIIDVSPINSGDIPGDTVYVQFNYNRYKEPEPLDEESQLKRDWERDETIGPPEVRTINYTGGVYSRTVLPRTVVETQYDSFDRVIARTETTTTHVAVTNPNYLKWYLENPGSELLDVDDVSIKQTTFNYLYPASVLVNPPSPPGPGECAILYTTQQIYNEERDSQIISQTEITYVSEMAIAGALNLEYSGTVTTPAGGSTEFEYQPSLDVDVVAELVVTSYEADVASGITKTVTNRQQCQAFTPAGNQVGASEGVDAAVLGNIAPVVNNGKNLVNLGSVVTTRVDRLYGLQRRPSRSQRNNDALRKSLVESSNELVFVSGNESSENIIVYSVPYVSDDRIKPRTPAGTGFDVIPSDAPVKAALYARVQNTLAFGHRNGFSLQLAAPDVPAYPLDRLTINASGNSAAFVCNGTSWSFDSNGIVCNTDALLVGGVGETAGGGAIWFSVQPGITLLGPAPEVFENEYPEPANSTPVDETFNPVNPPPNFWTTLPTNTPAVPKKQTTVPVLVPVWREEISYVFATRSTIEVTRTFAQIPTEQPVTLVTRTAITVFDLSARLVPLVVKTTAQVAETAPAIRADAISMFALLSFGSSINKS
jgi:hypothetical protein